MAQPASEVKVKTEKSAEDTSRVLDQLLDLVLTLDHLENSTEQFTDDDSYYLQINTYIDKLSALNAARERCQVEIPVAALQKLDAEFNNNPECYSLELLQQCKQEFSELQTRATGIDLLRATVTDWRSKDVGLAASKKGEALT